MTRTPEITGKSFIGFCPFCCVPDVGLGPAKGPPQPPMATCAVIPGCPGQAQGGRGLKVEFRAGWAPPAHLHPRGQPEGAKPRSIPRDRAGGRPGRRPWGPTLVSPALHSRGVRGRGRGDSPAVGRGTPAVASSPGQGQRPPQPGGTGIRSWCMGQRGDMAGKVLGGFTPGVPAPHSPPGSVPVPTHPMGEGWTPLHHPSHSNPGHNTDTTSQSLMGAARATSVTPQHTTRSPLPKTAHRKGVGEREPPSPPPEHTEAQQKHTARPWLPWRARGHQGMVGCSARGKSTQGSPRGRGDPSRLWGGSGAGGAESGQGAAGAKLGPNWVKLGALQLPCCEGGSG